MDVVFQPSRGKTFVLEVGYFDTVLEIKQKIQKDHGIPIHKQTLIFKGNVLQDELNVHHSDIIDRAQIQLVIAAADQSTHHSTAVSEELPSLQKIRLLLRIKSPKLNAAVAVEMSPGDSIRRLKEKIQETEGIPVHRLIIHANGTELQDSRSLQECEIGDNSEIDVSVRMPQMGANSNSSSGPKKLRIYVMSKCGKKKIPLEVYPSDNVGELKKKLQKIHEPWQLDLPDNEGYFFIYKQNVMDDDQSFRWHRVGQGDTIEIFNGSISGGS